MATVKAFHNQSILERVTFLAGSVDASMLIHLNSTKLVVLVAGRNITHPF